MNYLNPRTGLFLGGVGLAVGIAYVLSPDFSHARRHAAALRHSARQEIVPAIVQRARDARREVWNLLTSFRGADKASRNPELVGRVQFAVRRVLAKPAAVTIRVDGNRVLLSGVLSRPELDTVLDAVRRVRGVWVIDSRLKVSGAA